MSGFFENGSGQPGGLIATSDNVTSEGSFFENVEGSGTPIPLTQPFQGVLAPSTAQIGHVVVDNPVTQVTIGSMPPISGTVNIGNLPGVQPVSVTNPVANQNVTVTNPTADQLVHGTVGINNWPVNQNVTLTGSSQVIATLGSGSSHIGSVGIDGVVQTSGAVTNFPLAFSINNLPDIQPISGTVNVGNQQPFPAGFRVTNSDLDSIPVKITGGQSSFSGSLSAGSAHIGSVGIDGLIKLDDSTPIKVEVTNPTSGGGTASTFDGNVTLKAGTAHIGAVSLDAPVSLAAGTQVGIAGLVALAANAAVAITSLPAITGSVAITGTPTVALANTTVQVDTSTPLQVNVVNQETYPTHLTIDGAVALQANANVAINNFPTSFNIGNLPATQNVAGTVAISNPVSSLSINNLPDTQKVSIANTVNVAGTVTANVTFPANQTINGTVSIGAVGTANGGLNVNIVGAGISNGALKIVPAGAIQTILYDYANGRNYTDGNAYPVRLQLSGLDISNTNALPISGTVAANVSGTVAISNAFSGVLANSTATIGQISGITNTVTVAGSVNVSNPFSGVLAASSATIGSLQSILSTVNVAVQGTPTVKVDSTTPVNVTVSNPVAAFNGVLANSSATIGQISGITNTVNVAVQGGVYTQIVGTPTVATISGLTSCTIGTMTLSGSTFTVLAAATAKYIEVTNWTGTDLEYQRGGAGNTGFLVNGMTKQFPAITNANNLAFRRRDQSTTSLTVTYDIYS